MAEVTRRKKDASPHRRTQGSYTTRCPIHVRIYLDADGLWSLPMMSLKKWQRTTAAGEMIRHVTRVARREHLALLLADLVSTTWGYWQRARSDDWSFAWRVAQLRAWALGELSAHELLQPLPRDADGRERFTTATGQSYSDLSDLELSRNQVLAAGAAAVRAVHAATSGDDVAEAAVGVIDAIAFADAAYAEADLRTEFMDLLRTFAELGDDEAAPGFVRTPAFVAARQENDREQTRVVDAALEASRRGAAKSFRAQAETIRALVPYSQEPALDWEVRGSVIATGCTLLRLDGWLVVDVIHRDELAQLDGNRAVKLDASLV